MLRLGAGTVVRPEATTEEEDPDEGGPTFGLDCGNWHRRAGWLADEVFESLRSAPADSVTLLDLTGTGPAHPADLAEMIHVRLREVGRGWESTDDDEHLPQRVWGRRFFAVKWLDLRRSTPPLSTFADRWEALDREKRRKHRTPVPLVCASGTVPLAHLPKTLAGDRFRRLARRRLLTTSELAVPDRPATVRALGREARRYAQLGLLVRREQPAPWRLERMAVADPRPRARPYIWESVPGAATEFARRLRRRVVPLTYRSKVEWIY